MLYRPDKACLIYNRLSREKFTSSPVQIRLNLYSLPGPRETFVFHGRDGFCAQPRALPNCSTRSAALDEAAVARTGRGECQRSRIAVISGSPLQKTMRRVA